VVNAGHPRGAVRRRMQERFGSVQRMPLSPAVARQVTEGSRAIARQERDTAQGINRNTTIPHVLGQILLGLYGGRRGRSTAGLRTPRADKHGLFMAEAQHIR
jgi:hypothetical protein